MSTEQAAPFVQEATGPWTPEEISLLVSRSGSALETLTNVAQVIRQRFATDVCSVYLLEPDRANLVLAATVGLRPESVGQVRMRITEGLAGLVAEQVKPVVVLDAIAHPRFKYFRDAGEDPFRTFMGAPVIDRGVLQGVFVVQTRESRAFTDHDVRLLSAAGSQLSSIIGEARTLGQFVAPVHQRRAALAQNLWWSWDGECISLFRDLDPRSGSSATTIQLRCCSRSTVIGSRRGQRRWRSMAESTTPTGGCRTISSPRARGAPGTRVSWGRGRWCTSPRSSASTNRCPSTRVGSACWPATISRAHRTWASRSSAWVCTTTKATSGNGSIAMAGSTRSISTSIIGCCQCSRRPATACR